MTKTEVCGMSNQEQHPWRTALEGTITKQEQRIRVLEGALRELSRKIAELPLSPQWSEFPVLLRDNASKTTAYQIGHGVALLAAMNLARALLHDSTEQEKG